MKKIFSLLLALVCSVGMAWSETLLSYTVTASTETSNTDAYGNTIEVESTSSNRCGADGYKCDGKYVKVTLGNDLALAAGDVISITMRQTSTNNLAANTCGISVGLTSSEANATVYIEAGTAKSTDDTHEIVVSGDLVGANSFYMFRAASTSTYMRVVTITGTRAADENSPSITTDLETTPYEASVGAPLSLTIAADHKTGYQWYETTSLTADGTPIVGETTATFKYTPVVGDAGATKYFYCVVTNTNATGDKTAKSVVATINVAAVSTDASLSSLKYYGGTSVPNFDPETLDYNVTLAAGTSTYPNITATTTDATANVKLSRSGKVQSIVVTAQDGVTTQTYTITYNYGETPATPAGFDKFWNFSNWDNIASGYTYQTIVDGLKMEGGNYAIDACMNGAKAEGIDFTKRLNLGGAGKTRHFEFPVTGACVITVYGYNHNSGRSIAISEGDVEKTTVCTTTDANANTVLKGRYFYSGSGETIKMYSKTSGFYVLAVGVTYLSSDFDVNLVATNGSNNYATFSCARDVEFADGVTVYTISQNGDAISLDEVENKQVPAENGVLLKSSGNTATYSVVASAGALDENNMLRAASVAMESGYKFYKLAYDDYTNKTDLGFYYGAADGAAFTAKVGGAYLAVPATLAPARFLLNSTDEVTALENVASVEGVSKQVVNGRLFILRDGMTFDVMGRIVK